MLAPLKSNTVISSGPMKHVCDLGDLAVMSHVIRPLAITFAHDLNTMVVFVDPDIESWVLLVTSASSQN